MKFNQKLRENKHIFIWTKRRQEKCVKPRNYSYLPEKCNELKYENSISPCKDEINLKKKLKNWKTPNMYVCEYFPCHSLVGLELIMEGSSQNFCECQIRQHMHFEELLTPSKH